LTSSSGAESVFLNQAGLLDINNFGVSLSSEQRFGIADLRTVLASVAFRIDNNSVIGLGIGSYGLSDLKQQLLTLSYARLLSESLSLAVAFDIARIDAKEFGAKNIVGIEIGSKYLFSKTITLGLSIKNPISGSVNEGLDNGSQIALGTEAALDDKVSLFADVIRTDWDIWDVRSGISYQMQKRLQFALGFSTGRSTVHFGFRIGLQDNIKLHTAMHRHAALGLTPSIGLDFNR